MILVDTNVFLIDRFFKRDSRSHENRMFIEKLDQIDAYISIFCLLELCGISSFNLSPEEIRIWCFDFSSIYNIRILEPSFEKSIPSKEFFDTFIRHLFDEIRKKATLVDALLLKEIKSHSISTLVTWNKKHFEYRTDVEILTPAEFNAKLITLH